MNVKSISVLVVDDEPLLRMSLEEYLNDNGISTASASTGQEALDAVRGRKFGVAIVDLNLPDMTGEELILRCSELSPELRYIIQTGELDYHPSDRVTALGVDRTNVLAKPQADLHVFMENIERLSSIAS